MKQFIRKSIALLVVLTLCCTVFTGCSGLGQMNETVEQAVDRFLTAYQAGDFETMERYMDDDEVYFRQMADARSTENPTKEQELWRQVYDATHTFTYTVTETDSYYGRVTVTLTHEGRKGMVTAIKDSLNQFVSFENDNPLDMETLLTDALSATGEEQTETAEIVVSQTTTGIKFSTSYVTELYSSMTGGIYDYGDLAFATGTGNNQDTFFMMAHGDVLIASADINNLSGDAALSQEDIDQRKAAYDEAEGTAYNGRLTIDGSQSRNFIYYDEANLMDLVNLGVVDLGGSSMDYDVYLSASIEGYEENGIEFQTYEPFSQ